MFPSNGPSVEPMDVAYNLDNISSKNRDFSNPMYECTVENQGNGSGIYEVPTDVTKKGLEPVPPASAVLAPSSVVTRTSPQIHIRHRELDPSSDTGKDTQKLVEEDRSEC